jgi:hypothetical protein
MIPVVAIVLLAAPVLGGLLGFHLLAATGAVIGVVAGLLLAFAAVVLPFGLLVRAEKRKAMVPAPPPPDVPWA